MKTKQHSRFAILHTTIPACGIVVAAGVVLLATLCGALAQAGGGNALSLDGKDDHVVVPAGIWFGSEFTIEVWVYERSYNNWSRVIDFGNGPSADNVLFALSEGYGGQPIFQVYQGSVCKTSLRMTAIPLLQWVHLAVTLKSGTATLYVNGVPMASSPSVAPNTVNRTSNFIGRSNWTADQYANALFDDLRIWNVARTAEQIRNGMTHPLTGTEPHLVANWKFDETSGTVARDASVNRKYGTLVNGPVWTHSTIPFFVNINANLPKVGDGSSASWGDYDNDGWLDILLMGMDAPFKPIAQVWKNKKDGTFIDIGAGLPGGYMASTAWGDYDNNGFLDILLAGYTAPGRFAQVWRNQGNGTFTDIHAGLTEAHHTTSWGDFDNDGRLDILLTGVATSGPVTQVWRNNGDGTFTDIHAGLTGVAGPAAWGDYDNDGRLDILLAGYAGSYPGSTDYVTQVWRNQGNGTFADIHAGLTGVYDGEVAWGDYDNDGRLDILLTGWDNRSHFYTEVWRNTGAGFVNINAGLPGAYASFAAWGDYDNDGRLDILLTGATMGSGIVAQVWRNTESGFVMSELPGVCQSSVAWGDYDNDGRLDILLTGNGPGNGRVSEVWRNTSPAANTPPTAPTGLTATAVGHEIILAWNAAADAQTPASGLSYNVRVGTAPGGWDVVAPHAAAHGYRRVPALGNAQQGLTALLAHLPEGEYYWSVQAIDGAFAGSPFAPEVRFGVYRPVVATSAATDIHATGAMLHGTVNPRERDTLAWFEYGLTSKYGTSTATNHLGSGTSVVSLSLPAAGLLPWMTYHCRVVASNAVGRTDGADMTFTLPGPSTAPPILSILSQITLPQGGSTSVVFSVSDPDTPPSQLVVRTRCNNPMLFPNVPVGGDGGTRSLILTPDPRYSGSAILTVTVSDNASTASRTLNLSVVPQLDHSPLFLTNAHRVSAEAWQFRLLDNGSGSANYVVEYRPDLSPTNGWITATNITALGGGVFEVDTGPWQREQGYYRVKGFQLLSASLAERTLVLDEGANVSGPVVLFNGPYVGPV
ncbi:MAG TPA: FG-GAP-like repeat-containing protein, partial [Candidatus Paceibacterota bacterium]|nr:FG-GAP-like repeat-containing protein [Candidatus Paceibacterota bacterium]